MYVDILIRTSALDELLSAVLSRVSSIDSGQGPNVPPLRLRQVCSWGPNVGAPSGDIYNVSLSPNIQLLETRRDATLLSPQRIGPTIIWQPQNSASRVRISATLEVATATTRDLQSSNLGSPTMTIVGPSGPRDNPNHELYFSMTAAIPAPPPGTVAPQVLNIQFRKLPGPNLPPEFGGPIVDGFNPVNVLLQETGLTIPIPLPGLQGILGGCPIVAATMRGFGAEGVLVVRLLFVPVAELFPTGRAIDALRAALDQEILDLESRTGGEYVSALGTDNIAISLSPGNFNSVLRSTFETAGTGVAHIETDEGQVTLLPDAGNYLAFDTSLQVRLRGACAVDRNVPGSDLVAGIGVRADLEVVNERSLVMRFRATTEVHAGWALLCGLFLPFDLLRDWFARAIARRDALGVFDVILIGAVTPIAVAVSPLSWLGVTLFLIFFRGSQQFIAENSRGTVLYNRNADELVRYQPVPSFTLNAPAAFLAEPDPLTPGTLCKPPALAELRVKSISNRGGRVVIVLRLIPNIAGGVLSVRARPQPGQTPAPSGLANWAWTYRSCSDELSLALSFSVMNTRELFEPFQRNERASAPMEVYQPVLLSPTSQQIGFYGSYLAIEGVSVGPGSTLGNVSRVQPEGRIDYVVSMSLTNYRQLLAEAASYFPIPGGLAGQSGPEARRFIANPGYIVIRTSGGRRMIRLPSLSGVSTGEDAAQVRDLNCRAGLRRQNWQGAFGGRLQPFRRLGPGPVTLVDRVLQNPVLATLPQLNLPIRSTLPPVSLASRSLQALLGGKAPSNTDASGLSPSRLDRVPTAGRNPRGVSQLMLARR